VFCSSSHGGRRERPWSLPRQSEEHSNAHWCERTLRGNAVRATLAHRYHACRLNAGVRVHYIQRLGRFPVHHRSLGAPALLYTGLM
jgi:hypothetical protein